jgi:uncharacterized membrane protein YdjX (TVP38/TMEM64 family)
MKLNKKIPLKTILLFSAVVTAIVVSFVFWEADIRVFVEECLRYADKNLLLVALILFLVFASDIFLPVPSVLVGGMCGALLGLFVGFAVSFLAMMTSCAIGYAIGRKSERLARKLLGDEEMEILSSIHKRGGEFFLLALRPVPVLSEASTIFAGIAKTPIKKSFFLMSVGNVVVASVYASAGSFLRGLEDVTIPLFAICLVLCIVFMFFPVIRKKRNNIS